ncbi:CotH kinase family protein [Candidatus Saccharibacteria bacterium]|nr:CotH kinase family protein [Candidatus Saccharibacteria bacterium]
MKKKVSSKRWKWMIFLLAICIVLLGVLLKFNIDRIVVYRAYLDNGIPRININLEGVSLDEIKGGSKETKYEGNELELYNEGRVAEFDGVEVKGRGNSTWKHKKKPYQIKFTSKVDLFGLGEAKKWVLLANYLDHSFLRNDIAFTLAEMLEIKYSHRGRFVELYFNDEYEGLYYLVPKIDIAKGSVNLRDEDGALFELDNSYGDEEEYYESYSGNYLLLKELVSEDEENKEKTVNEFLEDFNKLEMLTEKGEYEKIPEIIDIKSFAKYYLVNEFTINPDAYSSSLYLYKDGGEDKIHAGPVWDFDLALANRVWGWGIDEKSYSPVEDMIRRREAFGENGLTENKVISKLFYYLMDFSEFREEVNRVYQEKLSGRKEELLKEIQDKNSEIQKAILKDNKKWGIEDSEEEFNYLFNWVKARYEYFEQKYGNTIEEFNGQRHFRFL